MIYFSCVYKMFFSFSFLSLIFLLLTSFSAKVDKNLNPIQRCTEKFDWR